MIQEYTIQNEQIKVTAINYGAAITGIYTKDINGISENIVCNYQDINDYINQPDPYLNQVVGPTSGRIAYGQCDTLRLKINSEPHHLHGGTKSVSFQFFDCEQTEDTLVFSLSTTHDEDGYPKGTVDYQITYRIFENNLEVTHQAKPQVKYPLYLTSHLYFNLSGNLQRDILSQKLLINASKRVAIDPEGHPVKIVDIKENSTFDFHKLTTIKQAFEKSDPEFEWTRGYDCAYIFDEPQIIMYDPVSKRELSVSTTANSVVVYSANFFDDKLIFTNGIKGKSQLALALETQKIPNGINIDGVNSQDYYHDQDHPFIQKTTYTMKVRD